MAPILSLAFNVPAQTPGPQIDAAVARAKAVNCTGAFLATNWNQVETAPGVFGGLTDYAAELGYFAGKGFTLGLNLMTLNGPDKCVPRDLIATPYDSPTMINRFRAYWDALRPHVPANCAWVSVGNEVDIYLASHAGMWPQYATFLQAAINYIHSTSPGLPVGCTVTFAGATYHAPAKVATLVSACDVYILTYYPVAADFTVLAPTSPIADFPRAVSLAGRRPVIFQEAGFPTAAACNSNTAGQAWFLRSIFTAWATNAAAIPFVSYFSYFDWDPAAVAGFMSGMGSQPPAFPGYLGSLGLFSNLTTPKAGWAVFVEGAKSV